MKLTDLVARADYFIQKATELLDARHGDFGQYVDATKFLELKSGALSFIHLTFGEEHPYFKQLTSVTQKIGSYETRQALGILTAVKNDLEGGWLVSTRALLSAEIFADFLDMAGYLLSENYKDAAAVMIGSVLEEHLRQLCLANGIDTEVVHPDKAVPKKADALNADLAKLAVYNKLDQKAVTTWLDLRNKAAHGHYNDYTRGQVDMMLSGVTEFMSRVSA